MLHFTMDPVPLHDLAGELGLSRDTLYRLVRQHNLTTFKRVGDRRTWIDREAVLPLVALQPKKAVTTPAGATPQTQDSPAPDARPLATDKPPVALAVIVREDRCVLMTQRRFKEGSFAWGFPSGQVELPGETPEQAVVREVREELAADVTVERRLGERIGPTGRHMIYFACRLTDGSEPTLVDHEELAGFHWLTLPDADTKAAPQGGIFAPVRAYLAAALPTAATSDSP
jgi:8-oxo-dGTP diphosphatase